MIKEAKGWFQELVGVDRPEDARTQNEWGRVRDFIRNNPGSNTRTICQKAGVRNKRANAILKARVESGEVVAIPGPGGSMRHYIAGAVPKVSPTVAESVSQHVSETATASKPTQILEASAVIGIQDSLDAIPPTPEPKILVSEAAPVFPESISGIGIRDLPLPPDLGLALLSPGPMVIVSLCIPEQESPVANTEGAPIPEPKSEPSPEPPPVPHIETEGEWSARMRREEFARRAQAKTQLNSPVPPEPQKVVEVDAM